MVNRYRWIPSGASLSGVSGAFVESDAQICQKLLGYIVDKRFLIDPVRMEVSEHVLASVQAVRVYAVNAQYLPSSRIAQKSILEIAAACRDYVRANKPGTDQEILVVALMALRKRIGTQLVALRERYALDSDVDLSEFEVPATEVLEAWFGVDPWETDIS